MLNRLSSPSLVVPPTTTNRLPPLEPNRLHLPRLSNLDRLEAEAIQILWETKAKIGPTALMFSGGKDSACIAYLAKKAFTTIEGSINIPFSFIHYDSGDNFPEVLQFRDETAKALGVTLTALNVHTAVREGLIKTKEEELNTSGNIPALIELINFSVGAFNLQGLIGGGRRDEEVVRAKERIFSLRNREGSWNPHDQRPEPWNLFNTQLRPGEHLRVFPISNWTERNVWEYIAQENIPLPSIYYAHERAVVLRNGTYFGVFEDTVLSENERAEVKLVRCRTVGDRNTTGFILSDARTPEQVLREVMDSKVSERAGRAEDRGKGTDMESRKRQGWP